VCHTNGVGLSFQSAVAASMSEASALTLRVRGPLQLLGDERGEPAFGEAHPRPEVGGEMKMERRWRKSHCCTFGVLCVARLSSTTFTAV